MFLENFALKKRSEITSDSQLVSVVTTKEELSFRLTKPDDRDDVPGKSNFFRVVNHSLARRRCPFDILRVVRTLPSHRRCIALRRVERQT